jgi:hypothetical protein
LSHGEKVPAILSRAVGRADISNAVRATLRFIQAEIDDTVFDEAAAAARELDRCNMHFTAMWLASLANDPVRVQARHRALLETGREPCANQLAYAKKLGG